MAMGALTLLSYFLPLGFIPDLDLSDMTGLLFLCAGLGLLQITVLGMCLLWPSLMTYPKDAIQDETVRRRHARRRTLFAVAGALLWFLLFVCTVLYENSLFFTTLALVMLVAFILHCFNATKNKANWVLTFGIQGFVCLIAIFLFNPAPHSRLYGSAEWLQWLVLALWCLAVVIANVALVKEGRPSLKGLLIAAFYLIAVLILTTHNLQNINGAAVRILKLGNIQNATITVNHAGSAVIQAACLAPSAPKSCEASLITVNKESFHAYSNLTILSRIGRQYYLQLCSPTEKAGPCASTDGLRVVLEKTDAPGWSRVDTSATDSATSDTA